MGVPPVLIHLNCLNGNFPSKPAIWGTPMTMETPKYATSPGQNAVALPL